MKNIVKREIWNIHHEPGFLQKEPYLFLQVIYLNEVLKL